jgi:uncharacterized membrane protein YvbJ
MSAEITCAQCGEVQSSDQIRCARCGTSLETNDQRRLRLSLLEQSRREAERNDVAIERLPGFGINGTPRARFGSVEFFAGMSNQLRRRYVITAAILAIFLVFAFTR